MPFVRARGQDDDAIVKSQLTGLGQRVRQLLPGGHTATHTGRPGAAAARTSDMFKALVSRGSKALQRLDERLNDEGEEDAFEEGWGEEERKALQPVSIDDVDVDDRDALRRRISKLQGMVVSMEEALEAERTSSRDTAQKLGRALQDAATVDGLVDEYGKLASEASRLSERDARTIAELAAQRDAQQTRLAVFERQLNDQDVQYAAVPSSDSTKTFAALRAAKAKIFELELELVDARKGVENGAAGRLASMDAALAAVSVDAARARLESKTDPRLASRVKALEAELAARPASSTLRDAEAAAEALRSELDVLRRRVADAERDAARCFMQKRIERLHAAHQQQAASSAGARMSTNTTGRRRNTTRTKRTTTSMRRISRTPRMPSERRK